MAAKVSVCMASYNHAPFIRAAVESVLNQTVNDWELVITDDGSSDGTIEALDGICDERIRIERFLRTGRPVWRLTTAFAGHAASTSRCSIQTMLGDRKNSPASWP